MTNRIQEMRVEETTGQDIFDTRNGEILRILDEAMRILRDDVPFDPSRSAFGQVADTHSEPGSPGVQYTFKLATLPSADVQFSTVSDPMNYSDDRIKVKVVPKYFSITFDPSISGLDRILLEERLNLANYWVGEDGKKYDGNSLYPMPPHERMHVYRYRANSVAEGRFPVNVEFIYFDPVKSDPSGISKLDSISIERAYPYVTPEQRKKKREEKEHRVRELYSTPGATK
ncbi:hypothetical protein [Paraburkholderia sp. J63]|uniref:hypothetical protein n=1 Tax=Paraburkholderia sp. J63 TaxID=2805434 RepID=UPI002ABDC329|nr:hypothetical protein [Paraburkholderia sp. J63]